MGALTEPEIFDCLSTNFKLAAQLADDLARLPAKGPTYHRFRQTLKLIEGAARQASAWREDARFLSIAFHCSHVHKVAGDWLRGVKMPDGSRRKIPPGELHPLFAKLAEVLRAGHRKAEETRTRATGRIGMILPRPLPGPHRDTRPVGWTPSPAGLLVPATVQ